MDWLSEKKKGESKMYILISKVKKEKKVRCRWID